MINFLHSFRPEPLFFSWRFINIHWYGLFIALGSLAAFAVFLFLSSFYNYKKEEAVDLFFYLIIFGLFGARLYSVLLDLPFYLENPSAILKIWQGGLAIHGAIIFGLLALMYLVKKNKWDFWKTSSLVAAVLPLGQAIGRWGNYFNQELFGYPTKLPFGIPIDIANRPEKYLTNNFFHPVFLYESLGNLLIFIMLFCWQWFLIKKNKISSRQSFFIVWFYLAFYSALRFFMETMRVDEMPIWHGWRWSQLVSLLVFIVSFFVVLMKFFNVTYFLRSDKR